MRIRVDLMRKPSHVFFIFLRRPAECAIPALGACLKVLSSLLELFSNVMTLTRDNAPMNMHERVE